MFYKWIEKNKPKMQVCGRPDARNGSKHINSTKVIRLVSTFTPTISGR